MVSFGFGPPSPSGGGDPLTLVESSFDDVAGGGTASQQLTVQNGVGEVVVFPDPLDGSDEHWPNSLFVTPDDHVFLGTAEV